MSDTPEFTERNVASQPISKSFKGILRVSNIKNIEQTDDKFLNPAYYGEYQPSAHSPWEPVGIQATDSFLKGDNGRYVTEDVYTTLKIPVTDSMGNYLNFSLGADSSLIGNTGESGVWHINGVDFNTLKVNSLNIGLSKIKLKEDKTIQGGKLFIENKNANIGKIVVNNYYRHGSSDDTGEFSEVTAETKTIYNGSTVNNLYDTFLFHQADIVSDMSKDENGNEILTNEQAIVKIENLKDYVMNKIGPYTKYNTVQIPPGTIVHQYCSVDKWYCRTENNQFDDTDAWQGYRPALGGVSTLFGEDNVVQGAYSNKGLLQYNMSSNVFESIELPPDFKRGYVLADGSAYTINFTPPYSNDVVSPKNINKTFDLFFDLFFTIGYYYTTNIDLYPHVKYTKEDAPVNKDKTISAPTEDRYYYDYTDPENQLYGWTRLSVGDRPISNETMYGISLITALAFKKFLEAYEDKNIFNEYIADEDGNWDIEKSISWLSKQMIPEPYVFNTVFSEDSIQEAAENNLSATIDNIIYKYNDADGNDTVDVVIGKEVKSFSDYIEYYETPLDRAEDIVDKDKIKIRKTYCQIYKMAEIYDIARLLSTKSTQWSNYTIKFNVPAMWTSSDSSVNEVNSVSGSGNTGTVGLFIGSNGLSLAESITLPSKDVTTDVELVYSNILDHYTYQHSNCEFTIGYHPHSHALAKGTLKLDEGNYRFEDNKQPAELTPLTIRQKDAKNVLVNPKEVENNIIAADVTWDASLLKSDFDTGQNWAEEPSAWNYFLQERGIKQGVELQPVYNAFNGLMGKELVVKKDGVIDENMLWYARTSEPLWDDRDFSASSSQKYNINVNPGYFRPQSIKLLPLIKL